VVLGVDVAAGGDGVDAEPAPDPHAVSVSASVATIELLILAVMSSSLTVGVLRLSRYPSANSRSAAGIPPATERPAVVVRSSARCRSKTASAVLAC
jgi:hypothetical protein